MVTSDIVGCAAVVSAQNWQDPVGGRISQSRVWSQKSQPSGSTMQENTGSGVQENGSRCAGLMSPDLKYLAAAGASLFTGGLEGGSVMGLQATVKLGGRSR